MIYGLPDGTDAGTPADAAITAYWTNGGTENFRNMIFYMDNIYFENDNTVNPPVIAECEHAHTISIIANDLERQTSIANATGMTNLSITVCTETEAELHDFSADELIFAASVNNGTLELIDSVVTENTTLVVYEAPVNSTIGTPADETVRELWEAGGDENMLEMLRYIEDYYFTTAEPIFRITADDDRPKISYVFSRTSEISSMTAIAGEEEISDQMHIAVHLGRSNEDLSFDLSDQDVILLSNIDAGVIEALAPTVTAARDNGAVIISMGLLIQSYNLHTVSPECNESLKMEEYLEYPSEHNYRNLARYMGATYCNLTYEPEEPETRPVYGIYHTDAPQIFPNSRHTLRGTTAPGNMTRSSRPSVS